MKSFLGTGDLYIDRLNADGTHNGLAMAGNADLLSLQANADIKQQTSKGRGTYGQVLATATLGQPPDFKLTLNQLDHKTLAMAFLGTTGDIDISAGTVAAEAVVIKALDNYFRLANRNIVTASGLTVSRDAGADASQWADSTTYALGDYVVPTIANEHFYKCTAAGDSDTVEPTWPTDGTTVTDGGATWQDMGTIAAVKDTDFEIISRTGMIRALSTGSIEAGETLTAAYDYLAVTGNEISGAVQPTIKAYIFLDGQNLVDGKDVEVEVWSVQLKPSSPVDFLAADFSSLQLDGIPETPTGKSAPFRVREID